MSLKRDLLFSRENIIPIQSFGFDNLPEINNIIFSTDKEELKWVENCTSKIGGWRSKFRSTYIRWAISINGLHLGQEKYSKTEWKSQNKFRIDCYRTKGNTTVKEPLIFWDGDTAAKAHFETVNMIASYGIIDLYSLFEEFIFDFFRTYKFLNPKKFITGTDNKEIRKLYNDRQRNPEEWESAWKEKLDKWQRKKIYEGIDKTFIGFFNVTNLKKPDNYKVTTPETWAETLKSISILRNCLVHGTTTYPKDLAEISKKPHGLGFNFTEGEKIELNTNHLMAIELFAEQLLNAMNLSLVEFGNKNYG